MSFDWHPTRAYSRRKDGELWRALSLGWSTLAYERWDELRQIWRLELEAPDGLDQVAEDSVDPELAAAEGEATACVVGLPGVEKLGDRGRWLVDRINETQDYLGKELGNAIGEVSMSRYGSSDYAYEMDVLIEIKGAYPTLAALWQELRAIQDVKVRIVRDAVEEGLRPAPPPGEYWP